MNLEKQKLLLSYLISSPDTFAICQSILKHEYFDPELRSAVKLVQDYYSEYDTTPVPDIITAETGIDIPLNDITRDRIQYCVDEVEKFCKRKAIEKAVISAPEFIKKGDYGAIEKAVKEAILVSVHKNLGLRYFENPDERLQHMLCENPVLSTGWTQVDELLFGGLARKELLLVSANSGGGKSITLANLAVNYVENQHNVLYISLELSEEIVAQRFDSMFTGISRKDWRNHVSEIGTQVRQKGKKCGILDIVKMPSQTNADQIRGYLKEYYLIHGFYPDLLVLDYLDKMSPNEKVSADNVYQKDKMVSEQLRDIGVDFNMIIATASQLNRDAVKATSHDHSHIAGGMSKINECDVYWSIKLTEVMKAKGEISFTFQKTRNSDGVGKTILLKWDPKFLRILDLEDQCRATQEHPIAVSRENNTLIDLINSFDTT